MFDLIIIGAGPACFAAGPDSAGSAADLSTASAPVPGDNEGDAVATFPDIGLLA